MARSFNGRQSQELYNNELYGLYEVLRDVLDLPVDPSVGPETTKEGALWLDRQNGGILKYFDQGAWKSLFGNQFKMISEILSAAQPENPVTGQLWLNGGLLMYYSGAEWLPVKSVNVDTEFNIASFDQFLIINPIPASGNQVVSVVDGQTVYKSQFLMPSVDLDKFFINGVFTYDYERVSNVAIQYPTTQLQGKVASAVHVNPSKLVGIDKKLILIDKNNPVIPVSELNTEFYGFVGGSGHLLLKTNDSTTEYVSVPEGIQLTPVTAAMYDFVMPITYKFKDVKQQGSLQKGQVQLNGTNSVYVGSIADPLAVFIQGMYLDEDGANYTYDQAEGFLNLHLESKMDVGVIAFSKKEIGTITGLDASNRGVITMNNTYTHPIVFVYGETTRALADYVQGEGVDANKLYVTDAVVGMKYAIVEAEGDLDDSKMWVKSGVTDSDTIPCSYDEIPGEINPILFAGGLLVSQKDITRNPDGSITAYGMRSGVEYVLLKDPGNRLVFNDYVSFTTIPTDSMDTAMLYVENQLICDSAAVDVTQLPKAGSQGEVKLLIDNGVQTWYQYDKLAGWNVVDPSNTALIDSLNSTAFGYSTSRRSISILQNLGAVNCVYYAYEFANAVEEPLLRGNIVTKSGITDYKVAFNHVFPVGANAISAWIDGFRIYDLEELNSSTIRIPDGDAIQDGNLFYVVEKPEKIETKSCQRQILTIADRVIGAQNIYSTKIPLYPGNLRVFIGGLRQPPTAYKVIDSYTIMFTDPIIGGLDNYPDEVIEQDGKTITIHHTIADQILIEVRQDFNLREVTLPVRYAGQNLWTTAGINITDPRQGGDALPTAMLDSKDFIMIYINGAAYGKDYTIDSDRGAIILLNQAVTSRLGVDPLDQYFRQNPEAYLDWKRRHGYVEYTPKPITDRITFEWR